jgi:2-phosphosulfolactate phosphatase
VAVIIDVFRACTTAAYILSHNPKIYILANKSGTIERLISNFQNPLLVGKPEKGVNVAYHIPNSPTRTEEVMVSGRYVLHRTAAGANGMMLAGSSDILLAAGFMNASATARYIKNMKNVEVIIIPMGHEGIRPSLEDNLCATYLKELIGGKKPKIDTFIPILQKGAGKYFFSTDQYQYPEADFFRCLEIDRFNFVIKANVIEDYAILTRIH